MGKLFRFSVVFDFFCDEFCVFIEVGVRLFSGLVKVGRSRNLGDL